MANRIDRFIEDVRARRLPPADERRRLRLAAGVSLREAAETLGVNAMTVARWESGVRPRARNAARYRQFLDALGEVVE